MLYFVPIWLFYISPLSCYIEVILDGHTVIFIIHCPFLISNVFLPGILLSTLSHTYTLPSGVMVFLCTSFDLI